MLVLLQGLSKTRSFLGRLSAQPDFVPAHLEELTAAALKQQQQQQQSPAAQQQQPAAEEQQPEQEPQQDPSSSSNVGSGASATQ
jgi:hypothetical protein